MAPNATALLGIADGRFTHISNTDEPYPEARFDVVTGRPRTLEYATLIPAAWDGCSDIAPLPPRWQSRLNLVVTERNRIPD
jgi:hypothetical protein